MSSIYLRFVDYKANVLTAAGAFDANVPPVKETLDLKSNHLIRVSSFSSDVVQTLNIGSQSTGAGAGRVTFNPFSITRRPDALSSIFFQNAASGSPFRTVDVFFANSQNFITVRHTYKLVAVKTMAWSAAEGDEGGTEMISFEYGALVITANQQGPDGRLIKTFTNGWNRVKNISDGDVNTIIS